MLKISRNDKKLSRLTTQTLGAAKIQERYDLQEYIFNSPEEFCKELGPEIDLKIIGKEVLPSEEVGDRIDLLALDQDGSVVIIELKRGNDKFQLLQAISYAAMIAKLSEDELLSMAGTRRAEIEDWLRLNAPEVDADSFKINQSQRILLVAEAYDYEVLVAAEWLYEKDVEIDCVRVDLAVDGTAEYLTFVQVFPTPELAEQARKRGKRGRVIASAFTTWEAAFSACTSHSAIDFFRASLAEGCEEKLQDRLIVLPVGNKQRFRVRLRDEYALAGQLGRFDEDITFWANRLTPPATIRPILKAGEEAYLRLFLRTENDFNAFKKAIDGELQNVQWK